MSRAIRGLAVAGLVAVAVAAWMAHARAVNVSSQSDIASYVPQFVTITITGNLLSFSAGVLTLALTLPRRQRPWSVALLASLILNAYWLPFYVFWWTSFFPAAVGPTPPDPFSDVVGIMTYGLAPAAPALLVLGYIVRAARPARQAPSAAEEQGNLDITIEPMGSEKR